MSSQPSRARLIAVLSLAGTVAGHAGGQITTQWIGPTIGAFGNPANWDNGVPGPADTAIFPASGIPRTIELFSPALIGDAVIEGQYQFNLNNNTFRASNAIATQAVLAGVPASARFFSGQVETTQVQNLDPLGMGQGEVLFESSSQLLILGPTGQPAPLGASIVSGVEFVSDPIASRRVRIGGPVSGLESIAVLPQGVVELPGVPFGAVDAQVSGSVSVATRGRLVLGRPLLPDGIVDNLGLLEIEDDTSSGPIFALIDSGYNQDARAAQFPTPESRSGQIELELFSPDLLMADRVMITGVARLGGGVRYSTPTPFTAIPPGASQPLVLVEQLDPQAPRFGVVVVPVTGVDRHYTPVHLQDGIGLGVADHLSVVDYRGAVPLELGGFSADADSADLNGDGFPDLVAALPFDGAADGALSVAFSFRDPAGNFAGFGEPTFYGVNPNRGPEGAGGESQPTLVVAFDADADGDEDIASYNESSGEIVVRLNDGMGGYDDLSFPATAVPGTPVELLAGQFEARLTGGGLDPEDLAVVIDNGAGMPGLVRVMASDGTGFDFCDIPTGPGPKGGDPIDIDGDQGSAYKVGFAIAIGGNDTLEIVPNPAAGGFGSEPTIVVQLDDTPTDVAAGDLDADGFPDVSTLSSTGATVTVLKSVSSLGGTPTRTFTSTASVPTDPTLTPGSGALAIGDVDEDGDADIFFASPLAASPISARGEMTADRGTAMRSVRFLRNVSDAGTIVVQEPQPLDGVALDAGETILHLVFGDFDGDRPTDAPGDDLVVITTGGHDEGRTSLSQDDPSDNPCPADVNMNGELEPTDFGAWLAAFNAGSLAADQNLDGMVTPTDFGAWLANYNAGCP